MSTAPLTESLYETAVAWLASAPRRVALAPERLRSLERFRALGLPSKKDEAWRYLPHKRVFRADLLRSAEPSALADAKALLAEADDLPITSRLVFIDGRYEAELSSPLPTSGSVKLLTGEALETDPLWSGLRTGRAGREPDAVTALGAALATEDSLLRFSGITEAPIALVHLTTASGRAPLVSSQLFLHLEAGAQAKVAQIFMGRSNSAALGMHQTFARLGEGASLEALAVATAGEDASLLLRTEAELDPASSFGAHHFLLQGGVIRNALTINLGEGARCIGSGLALASGLGHAEHDVLVHHRAPKGQSEQLYKTIANDRGRTAFSGRVVVDEVARGSIAHQTNRNLLLSSEAEVNTRPQLEIYAKEVEASHGATVGQLEEDQLFYLASRGVDASIASAMLRAAFIEETLAYVQPESLRSWVRARAFAALGVPPLLSDLSGGLDEDG